MLVGLVEWVSVSELSHRSIVKYKYSGRRQIYPLGVRDSIWSNEPIKSCAFILQKGLKESVKSMCMYARCLWP